MEGNKDAQTNSSRGRQESVVGVRQGGGRVLQGKVKDYSVPKSRSQSPCCQEKASESWKMGAVCFSGACSRIRQNAGAPCPHSGECGYKLTAPLARGLPGICVDISSPGGYCPFLLDIIPVLRAALSPRSCERGDEEVTRSGPDLA